MFIWDHNSEMSKVETTYRICIWILTLFLTLQVLDCLLWWWISIHSKTVLQLIFCKKQTKKHNPTFLALFENMVLLMCMLSWRDTARKRSYSKICNTFQHFRRNVTNWCESARYNHQLVCKRFRYFTGIWAWSCCTGESSCIPAVLLVLESSIFGDPGWRCNHTGCCVQLSRRRMHYCKWRKQSVFGFHVLFFDFIVLCFYFSLLLLFYKQHLAKWHHVMIS